MTVDNPLKAAYDHATKYINEVAERHVGSRESRADLFASLGGPLPTGATDPVEVINHLAAAADPGIVATIGPRYFGFVTGGSVPVTVAADWLVSAWDQNACLYVTSPAASVMEDIVSGWIV